MNCLDFRRVISTEPTNQTPDMLRHMHECSACMAFAQRQQQFEARLSDVLKIEAPEGLASRILLSQGLGTRRRQSIVRNNWLALAASVLLTIGLVGGMLFVNYPYSLQRVALAHVNHVDMESPHMQVKQDVSLSKLNNLLEPYNMAFTQQIGQVNFAGICLMRRSSGVHLVVKGAKGPVTILMMPGEYVGERKTMRDRRLEGVLIPTDNGSIAIIGEVGEMLEQYEGRIDSALNYI